MALTDTQKAKIRRYLGYPDVNREAHHDLEGAMDALSAEGETIALDILSKLDSMETTSTTTWSRAGIERVEDVWFSPSDTVGMLGAERSRLVNDLANLLDVSPMNGAGGCSSGVARRGA